jgi:dihydrolipoamide dehydrogenase
MDKNYDLIVIGSGPGGYVAAIRASQLGLKTAVVEKENLGGICLNWGCIPTKALLKSAEVMDYFSHASDYGFHVGDVKVDFSAIIKRSRDVADGMSRGIQFLFRKNRIQVLKGYGKLVKPGEVQVTYDNGASEIFSASHIIVATGGRSRSLPGMEIDEQRIIGYRKAMTLPNLPKTMLVMGSGAIGTEFAYFYNSIGTKVTIIEYMDRIIPAEDEDISKQLMRVFKKNGIEILTSSKVVEVHKQENGVKAKIETPTGILNLEGDVLLSAVGVVANLEEIGLDKLGVATENGKIKVNDFYQTNIAGIYAIGDIVHGPALAHKASAEGIICVEKIAGHHPEPLDYNNIPNCVYCQPEVASVGYTEQKAIAEGYQIKVGKFPFTASGKASAAGKKEGFVKVIFDAKYGEFLGAHMLGSNVTEMIAEVVVAKKLETTGHEIIKSVHPHPTMSEAVMEAAADAYGEVIHL